MKNYTSTVFLTMVSCLLAMPAVSRASGGELAPLEHRSVVPLDVAARATSNTTPPASEHESDEHYAVSKEEHELLQEIAASDPDAPRADQVVLLAAAPLAAATVVVTSFAGLDYSSSGSAVPPDTTIAKSGSRVFEATNSAVRLFNTSGGVLATSSTSTFVGQTVGNIMTDPKVFFDANSVHPRFFMVVEQYPVFSPLWSTVYVAVSRTSDPSDFSAASWCVYGVYSVATIGGQATYADSPIFGVGADTFVFTTNQFLPPANGGTFQGVVVYAGDKGLIENNAVSCPWMKLNVFQPGLAGDPATFALMPTQHYTNPSSFSGTTNPVYLASTFGLPNSGVTQSTYKIWRIRNVVSGNPSLAEVDVTGPAYETPPLAPQPPGNHAIDEGDVRVRQVAGIGDSLWATHTTTCTAGSGNQGCIRVLRFDVGQDAQGNPTATIGQQTTFIGPSGVFYWMPAIAATSMQSTVVPFIYGSTSVFLSSAFTTKGAAATAYPAATIFATGGCPSNPRTGDYQGAQTNPNDLASFWIAGEATQTAGSCSSLWRTQIANVTP
ncbi:MAG TPA: hypothetical protein VOA87_19615 [Thermoanaerobaculia bacterium]|nr:hypothetical protein [Thermoanaerobaculia bacterium]